MWVFVRTCACVHSCERTALLIAVTNCLSCRIQFWIWEGNEQLYKLDIENFRVCWCLGSKLMNGNMLAFCAPHCHQQSRLVSLPFISVSASSDTALCWTFCHNWKDFVLPSRLGFSNSKLISSLPLFSHPTLVPLLSHIAGMMVVGMWVLSSAALGFFFFPFLSFPWFSWLQKWMAQEKAGRAGGQMRGKRGFLAKAGRATRGRALPHLAPGRSCTFPEHTGLSLLPLNLRKWHLHPASQQSAQSSLYKRHWKIIFKRYTVPFARVRSVRGHWRLLSFPFIYFCSVCGFTVIFYFMATF